MNEDEAWERFDASRDEQFKKSSALGSIDVMQAQLNRLTADTEEIKQKIEEMSAAQNETPAAPAAPPAPEAGAAPDMGGAPEASAGEEQGDDQMDQSGGGLGETGQDTMAPDQPVENTSGGMPKMSDEDLDLLFGSGEENANEGTEESGGEPQDATLAALQEAISKATDPKVIADLAKMIVEYTGGGDSEGKEAILPGLPDEASLSDVPEEDIAPLLKSESFEKGDVGQPVAENVKASNEAAESNNVPGDSNTAVKSESPLPNEASKSDLKDAAVAAGGEPGPTEEPAAFNESCEDGEFKESDDEKKDDESDDKKEDKEEVKEDGDKPESKEEDADSAEEIPEAEVTEVEIEAPAEEGAESPEDDTVSVGELLDMSLGDIISMVKDTTEAPGDDANVFINDKGKESIPFTSCSPIKRSSSIDDLIMERENQMVGVDGKKYTFSKSVQNAKALEKLNKSLHTYGDVTAMKVGEVLSACKFMKSIGVRGVEQDNMDALDVIVRGLDTKIGAENTNAFMKSAGIDLADVYMTSEDFAKSEQPTQGGKHIPTLAEMGGTDIKKSSVEADVPRAADAGKAYVSPQDMRAKLSSIDDIIAGRIKG